MSVPFSYVAGNGCRTPIPLAIIVHSTSWRGGPGTHMARARSTDVTCLATTSCNLINIAAVNTEVDFSLEGKMCNHTQNCRPLEHSFDGILVLGEGIIT